MPLVGQRDCAPVGIGECAKGFTRDKRGWACLPVLPSEPCTGATRAALGDRTCVDVGDCDAAFPPEDATHFVSPTGAADATHFRTLSAAIAAAPAGAVIAVDDGTYRESISITRPIRVVGRCAARVRIDGGGTYAPGVRSTALATLARVGITGFAPAVSVEDGLLTLEEVALVGNYLVGVDVREGASAIVSRSAIHATRSVDGREGYGASVTGGTASIVESDLSSNTGAGVSAMQTGGELSLDGVVLNDTLEDGAGNANGAVLGEATRAQLRRVSVIGATRHGISAQPSAEVELEDVTVIGTAAGIGKAGMGIAARGANVRGKRVTVIDNEGVGVAASGETARVRLDDSVIAYQKTTPARNIGTGVYVFGGARAEVFGTAIVASMAAGIEVWQRGSHVLLDRSLVTATTGLDDGLYGDGLVVSGGSVSAISSSFVENKQAGLYAAIDGELELTASLVRKTLQETFESRLGHGIMVLDARNVTIARSMIESSSSVGVVVENSRVLIGSSLLQRNPVGVHVQGTSTLREVSDLPKKGGAPDVFVSTDTRFVENGSRVGSGSLPIPPPQDSL